MGTVSRYGAGTVFQRADGLWVGRIEAGWGTDQQRRRIQVSAKTEAACRTKLAAKRREIERDGVTVAGIGQATVKAWADKWLPEYGRRVRPRSYAAAATAVHRWIVPTLGRKRLTDLTPGDVRALRDAVTAGGNSTTTALRYHAVLTTMLRAAILEGHRVPERVLLTPAPVRAITDRDAIDVDQALAILAAAARTPDASRWVAAFLQGMRQAECLGLTWDRVDLAAGVVDVSWQLQALPYLDPEDRSRGHRVPDGYDTHHLTDAYHLTRPKTGAGRRVLPMSGHLVASLSAHRDTWTPNPWGLVWADTDARPGRERPIPRGSATDRHGWYALQDSAGVRHQSGRYYTIHEARHTAATLLMMLGVDEQVRIAILGHSSMRSTRGYQHANLVQMRAAMEALAVSLSGPAAIGPPLQP